MQLSFRSDKFVLAFKELCEGNKGKAKKKNCIPYFNIAMVYRGKGY